jgi:malate dehydrogenase (oxaloacetate-decarboxylating)(NADP+)
MKLACVKAIAELAMAEPNEVVAKAMGGDVRRFGPDFLIPSPFDPRLILEIAPAVAKAAMDSGVATRPIEDFEAYQARLERFVFRSGLVMKPIFERAKQAPKRVIYAEGEDQRVLLATQVVVDEGLARPILIGRPEVVAQRIERLGLRIEADRDFDLVNPQDDPRFDDYWQDYHAILGRHGIAPQAARTIVRTSSTVIAALAVHRGDADAMICGVFGRYRKHLQHVEQVIGKAEGVRDLSAINLLILSKGSYFLADTHVSPDPNAEELVEMTLMAADEVRRFGIEPKVALLSHSNFGTTNQPSALKVREAVRILHERNPELEVDGEMHGDAAVSEMLRQRVLPGSPLKGTANLLIMPTLDAANIAFNLLKVLGDGLPVGPILIGTAQPAHILSPSVTARGIVNMSAVAVVDAQDRSGSD